MVSNQDVQLPIFDSQNLKAKRIKRIEKKQRHHTKIRQVAADSRSRYGSGYYFKGDDEHEYAYKANRGKYYTYLKRVAAKVHRRKEKEFFFATDGSNYKRVFDIEWEYS